MNMVIAFVKEPVPGRVKTRLCPPLSHAQAAGLYAAFARDTVAALAQVPAVRLEVAYDVRPASEGPSWLGVGTGNWFQQDGADLGERMNAAFARAFAQGAARVVLIGSDIPDLDPSLVSNAFRALETRPLALGPAEDGGYYLVGLSRLSPELFRGMVWSTPHVLDQTIDRAERLGLSLELLPTLQDVDTPADLAALRARLQANPRGSSNTRLALAQLELAFGKGAFL